MERKLSVFVALQEERSVQFEVGKTRFFVAVLLAFFGQVVVCEVDVNLFVRRTHPHGFDVEVEIIFFGGAIAVFIDDFGGVDVNPDPVEQIGFFGDDRPVFRGRVDGAEDGVGVDRNIHQRPLSAEDVFESEPEELPHDGIEVGQAESFPTDIEAERREQAEQFVNVAQGERNRLFGAVFVGGNGAARSKQNVKDRGKQRVGRFDAEFAVEEADEICGNVDVVFDQNVGEHAAEGGEVEFFYVIFVFAADIKERGVVDVVDAEHLGIGEVVVDFEKEFALRVVLAVNVGFEDDRIIDDVGRIDEIILEVVIDGVVDDKPLGRSGIDNAVCQLGIFVRLFDQIDGVGTIQLVDGVDRIGLDIVVSARTDVVVRIVEVVGIAR